VTPPGTQDGRRGADAVLVVALAGGATAAEAAKSAGVSERTVRRRLADADFVSRVEAVRSEMLDTAVARVSAGAVAAVDTLVGLMTPDSSPSVRLAAARAILQCGIQLRDERQERRAAQQLCTVCGAPAGCTREQMFEELQRVRTKLQLEQTETEQCATRAELLEQAESQEKEARRLRALAASRS